MIIGKSPNKNQAYEIGKWYIGLSFDRDYLKFEGKRIIVWCMKFKEKPYIGDQYLKKVYVGFYWSFGFLINFNFKIYK